MRIGSIVAAVVIMVVSVPLTVHAQELRCGPIARGRPSADGTRCECVAPRFVDRVVGGVRRCVPTQGGQARLLPASLPPCTTEQHLSSGHCCAAGYEWLRDKRRCAWSTQAAPAENSPEPPRTSATPVPQIENANRLPAVAPTQDPNVEPSPMQRAQVCFSATENEADRNRCIINALSGRANSMNELGMLGATQMAAGHGPDASRTMRTYIQRFPMGPMVPTFQRYIDTHY
jgi:hypothetical protein